MRLRRVSPLTSVERGRVSTLPFLVHSASMYPETFERELTARCSTPSRPYRVRWNGRTETFAVEQKVARATEVPPNGDDFATSRVRDGYALVMEFSPTPTMKCPECGFRIELPALKIAEVRCAYCDVRETHDRQMFFTGYFPLCDALLTYLERTAPKRGAKWVEEMQRQNARVVSAGNRKFRNHAEAVASDYWKQVGNVPQVGYGNGPVSFGVL